MSDLTLKSQNLTINFLGTDKDARAIIGKNGSIIKDICFTSNCKVIVHGSMRSERYICLKGKPVEISAAVGRIAECLVNNLPSVKDLDESYKSNLCILMLVPRLITGPILGPKGTNLKNIEEVSKAKLKVLFDNRSLDNENILCIEGSPSQIAKAVEIVANVWQNYHMSSPEKEGLQSKDINNMSSTCGEYLSSLSTKCARSFYLDQQTVSLIIGKRGNFIRTLRRQTYANIIVEDGTMGYSKVEISGNPSCIALAIRLIEIEISLNDPDMDRDQRNHGANGNSRRPFNHERRGNYPPSGN